MRKRFNHVKFSRARLSFSGDIVSNPFNFCWVCKRIMAENLPFSIANILRSDFPHPSRISKVPSVVHVTPLRESRMPPFFVMRCVPVQRFHHCGPETRACSLHSVQSADKDLSQSAGDVQEQKQNCLTEEKKEGNFQYLRFLWWIDDEVILF